MPSGLSHMVGATAALLLAMGCGSTNGETIAEGGDLVHIHDLVVDDSGDLLAAGHTGLWRVEAIDRAVLVGTERHDLMSMAALTDGTLLVSGHPDLRAQRYRVEDQPPFLGLARSTDGGQSWEAIDLLGEADFHALVPVGEDLYGAETSGRVWRRDPAGNWEQLGEVQARDLAVDPADASRQLAPDYDGTVWRSDDGAVTWRTLDGSPTLVEIEWPTPDRIVGVSQDGTLWAASEPGSAWEPAGAAPPGVETFLADPDGVWWVTVQGGLIARSDDQATTWVNVYVPPGGS